jgi:hypothetical protein
LLVSRLVFAGDDAGLGNAGQTSKGGLDLTRLDAEAADLDLGVGAAAEVEHAVGPPASKVAGAVHALTRQSERAGDEALGGEVRTV